MQANDRIASELQNLRERRGNLVQIQREKKNRTKAREMIAKLSEEEKSAMQAEVISQLKSPLIIPQMLELEPE